MVHTAESKYVEKKQWLSRYSNERSVTLRAQARPADPAEWHRALQEELPRFIPFLRDKCGVEFRGRILEIGAGGAWLSAELSKLPKVVEVITTDISAKLLQEEAPQVFKLLRAKSAKITRTPADFHELAFPDNHFDYVVCSAVLQHAANMVQALRESKRVLKPGGQFVAIREPVWPLVKLGSRARKAGKRGTGVVDGERYYTLEQYKGFFREAALPLEVKRVNLSTGFKYFVDQMVNGITHARYAFIGTKRNQAKRRPAKPILPLRGR